MNDRWQKGGKRWNRRERDAVTRRFRQHVRTPSNPKGRIHRENCHFHPDVVAEAHHVDYSKPFLVAWLGLWCGCHRKVDHGSIRVGKKMLWDYSSLVIQRRSPQPKEKPSMEGADVPF